MFRLLCLLCLGGADLADGAEEFLLGAGMTREETDALTAWLTG